MALIDSSTQILPNTKPDSLNNPVWKATYKVFNYGGHRYVQIDSYGTNTRQMKDQPSQILQIEWNQFVAMFDGMLKQMGLNLRHVCNLDILGGLNEGDIIHKEL